MKRLCLALLLVAPAHAEGRQATTPLMQVKPGAKPYFIAGAEIDGCPGLAAKCRRKAYLVAGDIVVAGDTKGPFTFVEFVSAAGRNSMGWIATSTLTGFKAAPQPLSAWLGRWSGTEEDITITPTRKQGLLHAEGNALWGTGDPERVKNGGVHMGEFKGDFTPANGTAEIVDSDSADCRVTLTLLGPYLLTEDNNQCGGVNVSFNRALRKMGR